MSSSEPGRRARLDCVTDPDVLVSVCDARGCEVWRHYGGGGIELAHGLYRVDLERHGTLASVQIDLDRSIELKPPVPAIDTPTPISGAATWSEGQVWAAQQFAYRDTRAPLGASRDTSRLLIQIRSLDRIGRPSSPLSQPLAIHDRDGRELTVLTRDQLELDHYAGVATLSCSIAPGTYRLRAIRARRDLAITVPEGHTAWVFTVHRDTIALRDLRVAIVPMVRDFDPSDPVLRAAEGAVAALRTRGAPLPPYARVLLATDRERDRDLGFSIIATHLLWRANERDELATTLDRLAAWVDTIPDLAILDALLHGRKRRLRAPPLLRGSLSLAMSNPALLSCAADDPVARAARSAYADSVWCMWSDRRWDESWIEPTLEALRTRDPALRTAQFASSMAIPAASVTDAMLSINVTTPTVDGRPLGPGDVSVPEYRLEAVLGRGGQGTVFRASRMGDGESVALKVVPLLDAEHARRVKRGLELEGNLHHDRLLTARDYGVLGGGLAVWIETELCRGSVLDVVDEKGAALPIEVACRLVLDALDGLEYLHAHGAVHRDIKPGNLLVRRYGEVVIADFGLAKGLSQPTLTPGWVAAGTLHFAAPEQLEDFKSAGPASDVWSMAATLYFLLTLELPREQYAGQSELVAALDNAPLAIRHWAPDLPIALADCIDGALSRDVARRPQDGGAFRRELRRALDPSRPMGA